MSRLKLRNVSTALALALLGVAAQGQVPIIPEEEPELEVEETHPELGFRIGRGQSDNIARAETPVRSDLQMLGMRFNASSSAARMEGVLAADIELRKYETDLLQDDDEIIGSVDGALNLQLVPNRFAWTFEQNFGQMRTDPFAPIGPENRERTRVFSTGPQLTVPIADRNALQIAGRVSDRHFDQSDRLDSRLTTASLGFTHAIDRVTRVSIAAERHENEFDASLDPYEFQIVSATYSRDFASGGVELTVGRGEVDLGQSTDTTTVTRFEWTRGIGARSQVSIWAGRELTDAGELFRTGGMQGFRGDALTGFAGFLDVNDSRLTGIVLAPDPLRRSSAGLTLNLVTRRTTLGVSLVVSEDRFEANEDFNNDFEALHLDFERNLGRRWSANASVSISNQDFAVLDLDYEDAFARFELNRALGRGLRAGLAVERNRRDSSFAGFDENVYLLTLSYDL